jgi:hypothetical protein
VAAAILAGKRGSLPFFNYVANTENGYEFIKSEEWANKAIT